jgi:hypothetical protein
MNRLKKRVAWLLVIVMVLVCVPLSALAATETSDIPGAGNLVTNGGDTAVATTSRLPSTADASLLDPATDNFWTCGRQGPRRGRDGDSITIDHTEGWSIGLPGASSTDMVSILPRQEGELCFPSDFTIEVRAESPNAPWRTAAAVTGYTFDKSDRGDYQDFKFPRQDNVRYVRFRTDKLYWDGSAYSVSFTCVQVWGTPDTVTPDSTTAEKAADKITLVDLPAYEDEKVAMPAPDPAYAGCTVRIAKSSDPGVIDLDGNITRPAETTGVYLTFEVNDGIDTALTRPLLVPIYKPYVAPAMTEEEIQAEKDRHENLNYGMFVHYVHGRRVTAAGGVDYEMSVYPTGLFVVDTDDVAKDFDAEQFAKDMHEYGVEYVIFTAFHAGNRTLFPSMANKRWRDDRRSPVGIDPKSYSDTDAIEALLDALEPYGIDLYLYTHVSDGTVPGDFSAEEQALVGTDSPDNYSTWYKYREELFMEMCERYGTRIKGLWFDGMSNPTFWEEDMSFYDGSEWTSEQLANSTAKMNRFKSVVTKYNPAMILTGNTGWQYWNSIFHNHWPADDNPRPEWRFFSPYMAIEGESTDPDIRRMIDRYGTTRNQVCHILGDDWWSSKAQNTEMSYELPSLANYLKYVIAESSVSTAGGFAASAGNYVGKGADNVYKPGSIWEKGIYDFLADAGKKLNAIGESFYHTNNGKAYVTPHSVKVGEMAWGVSNESKDGKYVYLHVLNPDGAAVSGKTLTLGPTADGTMLGGAATVLGFDGAATPVTLERTPTGYKVTLPRGMSWDPVDTVIKVQRTHPVTFDELNGIIAELVAQLSSLLKLGNASAADIASLLARIENLKAQIEAQRSAGDKQSGALDALQPTGSSGAAKPAPVTVLNIASAQKTFAIVKGKTLTLPVTGYLSNGGTGKLSYASSDKKVASVDRKGRVKAKKAGKTIVTVTSGNKKLRLSVYVVKKALKVKSLKVRGIPSSMAAGKSTFISATLSPAKATVAVVTFRSSNPTVVSVDKAGKLVAVGMGKAVITVKAGKKTVKKTVRASDSNASS